MYIKYLLATSPKMVYGRSGVAPQVENHCGVVCNYVPTQMFVRSALWLDY